VLSPKEEVSRIFRDVQAWGRNTKVLVATEIFWMIPMMWVFFYQTIFPMLGGYLADRFGRKRVIMFFDNGGWFGYACMLFVSREFWQIIVAMAFQGLASTAFGVWQTYLLKTPSPVI